MNFRFYRLIFCQCTAALANAALRFALSLHLYLVVCGKIYGTLARRYFPILVGKWRPGQPVSCRCPCSPSRLIPGPDALICVPPTGG